MYLVHGIGKKVEFVAGKDIEGIITGYLVRENESIQYAVEWFHNGESKSGWFIASQLKECFK